MPATTKGTSSNLVEWLPLADLEQKALKVLHDSVGKTLSLELDRIDIRITGVALLLFSVTGFWLWYGPKRMKKRAKN